MTWPHGFVVRGRPRRPTLCVETGEDFVIFYDFPQEHWLHLRTTNPLDSVFAGVLPRVAH